MGAKWFGASVKRKEDPELLTGRGRYVSDLVLPGMLHAKTISIDGVWSLVGSYNLDSRSLVYNWEVTLEILDPAVAAALDEKFRDDLENSEPIDPARVPVADPQRAILRVERERADERRRIRRALHLTRARIGERARERVAAFAFARGGAGRKRTTRGRVD